MALWIVQKVTLPTGDAAIECVGGNVPAQVTLKDTDTGTYNVVQLCYDATVPPCEDGGLLARLTGAGYTPADWDAECAP